MSSTIKYNTIDDYIEKSLKDLSVEYKKKKNTIKKSNKSNLFDKYKIKLKSRHVVSALRPTTFKKKYKIFDGSKLAFGPANANGMDSSLSGDIGALDGGWGVGDGWGVTAFGESISYTSSKFIDFIRDLSNTGENNDVLSTITDGYKTIFRNVEAESTAILCGIQPSMIEYMNFDMNSFVFALNNFMGTVISLYLGTSSGMESIDTIKEWYLSIGVDQEVVDNIIFIEKHNTEFIEHSIIDINIKNIELNEFSVKNSDNLHNLCTELYNPILIGCGDVYFMGELLHQFAAMNKHVQIDKKFIYLF